MARIAKLIKGIVAVNRITLETELTDLNVEK